ncbi:MAG: hypothetical protein AAFV33_16440 [Chloroflexota bacterium]
MLKYLLLVALIWVSGDIAVQGTAALQGDPNHESIRSILHPDDLALIEPHLPELSDEQIDVLTDFVTSPDVFAPASLYDASSYSDWNQYNFEQLDTDRSIAILGRRDLFLDPARQLNEPALTNMSPEALAALAFSQTYVEEMWDQVPPWDGDPNVTLNWIHDDLLLTPEFSAYFSGDFIYRERNGYWFATEYPGVLLVATLFGIGRGPDWYAVLHDVQSSAGNPPRLAGHSFPIANQLFTQTMETAYWYADYLAVSPTRYGITPKPSTDVQLTISPGEGLLIYGAEDVRVQILLLYSSPYADLVRSDLMHMERAALWNVMRYVHAGARQREGGGSERYPGNNQPALFALRYDERSPEPMGRSTNDISAFSLLTTVYSDSILPDFTNWNPASLSLIVEPIDSSRSDRVHRLVSERNKAITVIEQMGSEVTFPNATHVAGSRGLGFELVTKYDDRESGDFLPYTSEEAAFLVNALSIEAGVYSIEESGRVLCNSPLLRRGYEEYVVLEQLAGNTVRTWREVAVTCDL